MARASTCLNHLRMWNNHNIMVTDWGGLKTWTFAFLLTAGAVVSCLAIPVDTDTAHAVADAFMASSEGSLHSMSAETQISNEPLPIMDSETGEVLAYVIDLAPRGYIVVGPDTRLVPIIAHSREGVFLWDEGPSNVLLHLLRADLAARLDALEDGALSQSAEDAAQREWKVLREGTSKDSSTTAGVGIIGPLIEATTWDQDAPWSNLAPMDPQSGERSLVGCVATALAQIVTYWHYPEQIVFTARNDYVSSTRRINVSATSANISCIEYPAKSFYNPDDEMMASLSYAAGVSVRMDYTSTGSRAHLFDMAYALSGAPTPNQRQVEPAVWDYESADVRTYVLNGWGSPFSQSQSQFYQDLQEDIQEGAPAVLNIVTHTSIGHAIICDGYDPVSGRYHLNLGWGGYSDGWYDLPEDIPSGYNVVEFGILNIRPPADRNDDKSIHEGGVPRNDDGETPIRVSPIPLETETVFSFTEGVPTTLTVRIFTVSGQLIWEQTLSGESEIIWDGCDFAGTRMANGPCIYVVSGFAGMQPFIQRGILFIHR